MRISSIIFVFLICTKAWCQNIFQPILDKVTCEIDSKLAKEWARSEIKIYFENNQELLNAVEDYFDQTPQAELNRRCRAYVADTMSTALNNIHAINPELVEDTLKANHSMLKFQFVDFCESLGRYLYAGACFQRYFLFKTNEIQVSSFNQGIAIRMFFPNFKYRFENFSPVLAVVHEFFHYLGWDNQSRDKHENPYAFEADDAIYSCTNMAFPGHSTIYDSRQKSILLQKQNETCSKLSIR